MTAASPLPLPFSRADQAAGRLAAAAVALGVFILLSFARDIFNDGDTGWHLATGRLILESRAVPAIDPFSYTAAGTSWFAHEWLAEVIMAAALAIGGWPMLAMTIAAVVALAMYIAGTELARWLDPPKVIIVLLLAFAILFPFLLARPHVFAWPLLAGWTVIMLRAREADRPPPLMAAALMLVWANLHASFIFGLLIAAGFGLEALIMSADRRAVVLGWGRFGLVALGATLLTPRGIEGLTYPLMVSSMSVLGLISEWQPTQFPKHATFGLPLLLTLFVLLWRGVKVPPVRLLLLFLMLYLAMAHVRHQQLLAIVGCLILAEPLGRAFGRQPVAAPAARLGAILAALLVMNIAARFAIPGPRPDSAENPGTAIAGLPAELRRQHVLNEYGFGGSLIFAGIAPFIDGRADMYGDAFTAHFRRISDGDIAALNDAAKRWNIGWTIFKPDTPIVSRLDADPNWQRLRADRWAVVHVRRRPADAKAAPQP